MVLKGVGDLVGRGRGRGYVGRGEGRVLMFIGRGMLGRIVMEGDDYVGEGEKGCCGV